MPPPPSKKQKRETNNSASSSSSAMRAQEVKSLIITPGGSPADTKIRVSLTDFYISSVLLKSHSPWFYDLYDKVVNDDSKIIVVDDDDTLPRYRFRAEWKDESWTLVRRQVPGIVQSTNHTIMQEVHAETAFMNVMNALTHKSLELARSADIIALTKLAELYGVLPVITIAIDAALFKTPSVFKDINEDPCNLLVAAYKLRHQALYNDCYILCLGPNTKPRYENIADATLRGLCAQTLQKFKSETGDLAMLTLDLLSSGTLVPTHKSKLLNIITLSRTVRGRNGGPFQLPAFIRCCSGFLVSATTKEKGRGATKKHKFVDIMQNGLQLDSSASAGDGIYSDYFLCSEVGEFPWKD